MNASRRWACWLLTLLAVFFAMEIPALRNRVAEKPSDTLSATFRTWIGAEPKARRRFILVPAFAAFCAWLAGHMCMGWWKA